MDRGTIIENQIKSYGIRAIKAGLFDPKTMIDITDDIENSGITIDAGITNNIIIDGSETTLTDIQDSGCYTSLDPDTFYSDPIYGVGWGDKDWNTYTNYIEFTGNINEIEITWTGLTEAYDAALGYVGLMIGDSNVDNLYDGSQYANSSIRDVDSLTQSGQSYKKNGVWILDHQSVDVINDTILITGLNATKIRIQMYYANGYAKAPRYINYLRIGTRGKLCIPIHT